VHDRNATNITDITQAIETLNAARKTHPELVQITPESTFCMKDESSPAQIDLNECLHSLDETSPLQNVCTIDLKPYIQVRNGRLKAISRDQNEDELEIEDRLERNQPKQDEDLTIERARYKDGTLELLLCNITENFDFWLTIDEQSYKPAKDLETIAIIDRHLLPTGRCQIANTNVSTGSADKNLHISKSEAFKVTGSPLHYSRNLLHKPTSIRHKQCILEEEYIAKRDSSHQSDPPPKTLVQDIERLEDDVVQPIAQNIDTNDKRFSNQIAIILRKVKFDHQVKTIPDQIDTYEEIDRISVDKYDQNNVE
jgi:hypothetical protein